MRSNWWWRSPKAAATSRARTRLAHVFGYGVGIDLTRRDLQQEAKDKKRPWDWGKGFDNSAPMQRAAQGSRDRPSRRGPHPSSR